MYRSNAVLLSVLLWLAGSFGLATGARAEVSAQEVAAHKGRVVGLERLDGQWVLAKILRVDDEEVVVELEDGTVGSIRLDILARVHTSFPAAQAPAKTPERASPTSLARTVREFGAPYVYAPKHENRVEWIGVRGLVGFLKNESHGGALELAAGAEVTAFVLHTKYFYWEALRLGGIKPLKFIHGTAMGIPIHLDQHERHELRIGAHLTFSDIVWPGLSGAALYYQYRAAKRLGLQLGILQHSSPLGFTITFGISL
ncbi:MAG: hypothetical protein ABI333_27065 [bacterium]